MQVHICNILMINSTYEWTSFFIRWCTRCTLKPINMQLIKLDEACRKYAHRSYILDPLCARSFDDNARNAGALSTHHQLLQSSIDGLVYMLSKWQANRSKWRATQKKLLVGPQSCTIIATRTTSKKLYLVLYVSLWCRGGNFSNRYHFL